MNSQTPKYYRSLYINSRVNMYNQSSFSCRIVKFQLRLFKFVFVLQVNVGPLAVVSCDTQCLSFIQRNKNSELLRLINQVSQKGKRIAWLIYLKIRWDFGMQAKYLFTSTSILKKQRFVKFLLFLHFIATGKFELLGILSTFKMAEHSYPSSPHSIPCPLSSFWHCSNFPIPGPAFMFKVC